MHYKVIFTDYDFDNIEIERRILDELNCEIVELNGKGEAELAQSVVDADALIVQNRKISKDLIARMTKCKVIARYGIGVDPVDIQAANEKGILVCNAPQYCIEEVTEHVLALSLALHRKIFVLQNSLRALVWDPQRIARPVRRLCNLKLGLIGFGKIPRKLVQKAKGLFDQILVYDPYFSDALPAITNLARSSLEDLLQLSDFVSVHCPISRETHHLIGDAQLKLMKPSAYLINTARGPVVDTCALVEALRNKRIAGAGLDVFEREPVGKGDEATLELFKFDNVILTPHAGYYSEDSIEELKTTIGQTVLLVLKGGRPSNIVGASIGI